MIVGVSVVLACCKFESTACEVTSTMVSRVHSLLQWKASICVCARLWHEAL